MVAHQTEVPKVIVFEENDPLWLELAEEGAGEAGWHAVPFMSTVEALEALDSEVRALITGLGYAQPLGGVRPARQLINRSDELNIPRALLSGHPGASRFIRKDSSDIVIPKENGFEVPRIISGWLMKLSLE